MSAVLTRLLAAALVVLAAGCSPSGPEAIRWGADACDHCRMILSDRAFGAEFIDPSGRAYKFDGVDELARFLQEHPGEGQAYVADGREGSLVPADGAAFLHSSRIKAPMGGNVMTFASRQEAERFAAAQGLKDIKWPGYREVLAMYAKGKTHEHGTPH